MSVDGKGTKEENLGKLNVIGFKQKSTALSPTSKSHPSNPVTKTLLMECSYTLT